MGSLVFFSTGLVFSTFLVFSEFFDFSVAFDFGAAFFLTGFLGFSSSLSESESAENLRFAAGRIRSIVSANRISSISAVSVYSESGPL